MKKQKFPIEQLENTVKDLWICNVYHSKMNLPLLFFADKISDHFDFGISKNEVKSRVIEHLKDYKPTQEEIDDCIDRCENEGKANRPRIKVIDLTDIDIPEEVMDAVKATVTEIFNVDFEELQNTNRYKEEERKFLLKTIAEHEDDIIAGMQDNSKGKEYQTANTMHHISELMFLKIKIEKEVQEKANHDLLDCIVDIKRIINHCKPFVEIVA
ncbi:hypothetical protein [Aquimarina algiphila]|uniref:Uncharacterized protein n=1 Tax=Aquimarina algiphila TaxID=2047982 RepID=A0A554VRL5_9FLAO|nr:hypothetical protein [Aquimarina algiphila]TSE11304.1 hypothetical protein FOF46_01350 [Aquimarina algiphila]